MSNELLARIGSLAAVFIFVFILIKIGFKLKEFISKSTNKAFIIAGNALLKIHNKNIQKAAITSKKTFAKGKTYKKVNKIIFNLGLEDVTVEGFLCGLFLGALVIGFAFAFITRSILFFIFSTIASFVLLYTLTYMAASEGHFKREFAIMDAIDLIIVNMKDGVLKAVKENIEMFNPIVKEDFLIFIEDMYEYKIPVEEALDSLGERLGPGFTKFKEKAKEFEAKGRAGMLETFQDDMNENMYRRMDLRELLDTIREANLGFAMALGVCGLLAFALIGSNEGLRNSLLFTTPGRIILIINLIFVIAAFAYLQSLREDKKEE